jgi:hypothetical protein
MLGTLFIILAAIVLAGGLLSRRRIRDTVEGDVPLVTDEVMRRILEEGDVSPDDDEPLDEDRIREAEDRFWDEEWDRPEEF